LLSETVLTIHDDEWRKELNRAVHTFASSAAGVDDAALRVLATSMLREIGDALRIECSVFLAQDAEPGPVRHYAWSRMNSCPFESPVFQTLLSRLDLGRDALVLTTDTADESDPAVAGIAAYLRRTMVRALVVVPVGVDGWRRWAWALGSNQEDHAWPETVIEHLQVLGDHVSSVLPRVQARLDGLGDGDADAEAPVPIVPRPRPVKSGAAANRRFEEIVGQSRALQSALAALEEVVDTDSSVLLLGETGTGKELFARALHSRGPRRAFPLISVNCAALPPTLIESELFGHQRGAFTGAVTLRQGRFELAHRGTLFLDEIGDLPLDLQPKLLRVLQEGAFERVGSSQTHAVNVRIVAATHRDLGRAVADSEFRADLFYRLNVFPIRVPPLRERMDDVPALLWGIVRKRQGPLHRHITTIPDGVIAALQHYSWPGNIRELENVVERALIHTTGETLMLPADCLLELEDEPAGTTLMSVERAHIEDVLRDCGWRINGMGNAAERLGLHPNTLRFRMKKLGIVRQSRDPRKLPLPTEPQAARHRAS
jgi:transcriptional regulator with GAF, ATPase, and Fis domain